MHNKEIFTAIELEMRKIKKETPSWPDHVAAQAGYVASESGNLMFYALKSKYGKNEFHGKFVTEFMKQHAIRTAAMAIRFLENLKVSNSTPLENLKDKE